MLQVICCVISINTNIIVLRIKEDYRLETRPVPSVEEGEVLVKVLAVGVCAGDAKCFAGAPYFWGMLLAVLEYTLQ